MFAAKKDKLRERVVASESTGSDTYSGSMRLTEKTFTEAYNDPSSSEYIVLKEDFEKSVSVSISFRSAPWEINGYPK